MIRTAAEKLAALLRGDVPDDLAVDAIADPEERAMAVELNRLFAFVREVNAFIVPLARGELHEIPVPARGNFLGSPFKELHSRLCHLTWQARQVAAGDYSQRVDFMGEFSEAFNSMIVSLAASEALLKNKIAELEDALLHIKRLEGILPICSFCRRVRADSPETTDWVPLESYVSRKTEARFSHSICPDCLAEHYPDIAGG